MDTHGAEPPESGTVTRFTVRDAAGAEWKVEATWAQVAGRPGAVRLVLHSDGRAAVSSTLVRQVERELRAHAPAGAPTVVESWLERPFALSGASPGPGEAPDVVELPPIELQEPAAPRMGRPRDDAAWERRRKVVLTAWRERQSLLAALEADEPGLSPHTYRSRLRTLYSWDTEHGGQLRDVGRGLREGKGDQR